MIVILGNNDRHSVLACPPKGRIPESKKTIVIPGRTVPEAKKTTMGTSFNPIPEQRRKQTAASLNTEKRVSEN
ncbi:MAG: hypothetical protein LBK69_03430 [Syntrophomonadaceae bacterium]|nr:hypothetical protein [Syntrophomonadaceae bacterium]